MRGATGLSQVIFTNLNKAYFDVDLSENPTNIVKLKSVGGDTLWTNNGYITQLVNQTNAIANSDGSSKFTSSLANGSGFTYYGTSEDNFPSFNLSLMSQKSSGTSAFGRVTMTPDTGFGSDDINGFLFKSQLPNDTGHNALNFDSGTFTLIGQASGSGTGAAVGVIGVSTGDNNVNYGVTGWASAFKNPSTNIAVAGSSFAFDDLNIVAVGGYFEARHQNTLDDPIYEKSILLIDNQDSGYPLITARTNNGTVVFQVTDTGLTKSTNGFSSFSTDAAVSISPTGWTNSFGKNAVVRFDGAGITYHVLNNSGISVYTNSVTLGHSTEILQPNGAIVITAGSSVEGTASPF